MSKGVDIDIYQESDCRVTSVSLSIAYGASVAKLVTRYRMLAIAWIIAWIAAAISSSLAILESTGERVSKAQLPYQSFSRADDPGRGIPTAH